MHSKINASYMFFDTIYINKIKCIFFKPHFNYNFVNTQERGWQCCIKLRWVRCSVWSRLSGTCRPRGQIIVSYGVFAYGIHPCLMDGWMFQMVNVLCSVAPSAIHRVNLVLFLLLCALNNNRPVTSLKQSGLSSQIMFQTLSSTPSRWCKNVGKGGQMHTNADGLHRRIGEFATLGLNQLLVKTLLPCNLVKAWEIFSSIYFTHRMCRSRLYSWCDLPQHLDKVALKTKIKNKIS